MGTLEIICGPMFSGKTEELVVGAADAYEPRCRKCFSPEPRPATAPPEQQLFAFVKRAGSPGT